MSTLIDRDQAIRAFSKEALVAEGIKEWNLLEVGNIIFSVPTVDPVKHGYWQQKDEADPPKCSVCGRQDFNFAFSFYCPHCGARMEIGDEE